MENPFEQTTKQRPTMLTVICILTFIGSGWGFLSNVYSIIMRDAVVASLQTSQMTLAESESEMPSFMAEMLNSSAEVLEVSIKYSTQMAVCNAILLLISLLGAYFMFKLRRMGFYLYSTAQVLMLFVLPAFAGFSMVALAGAMWSALFAALFIALYGVNLKYMKPSCTQVH